MNADLHTLTGAYAAHALSAAEELRFEEHLEQCDACRLEVRELRETTAALAAGVAQAPPPDLRSRVLAEIATTRQLPPHVPDDQDPAAGPAGPAGTHRRADGTVIPLLRRRWFGPTMLGVAAVLLLLVATLGVATFRIDDQLDSSESKLAALSQVLGAPDAREVFGTPGAGTGRLVVARSTGKAVFFSSGLTPAPEAKDYQLWLLGDGKATSVGLLQQAAGGVSEPVVMSLGPDAEQFGITLEPTGGSDQPTSSPLVVMALPA